MIGPVDSVNHQEFWNAKQEHERLFSEIENNQESTDLIMKLNANIETLQDLYGRLSFSLREISQVLKVKS